MFSALDLAVSEFACFDQIVLIAQEVYYIDSINSVNDIRFSTFNITEPIGLLVSIFIVLRFKPTNDKNMVHYHLIKKILLAVLVVSAVYGLGNEFLRIYGSHASLLY